ncbi:metal-dependent transcriptional regulator [Methanospirillum lacunae]|uniref:Metal-dependent transcriptional regulator n=1 Tax=Methanospirillum lacunae TaxID=668570 RepID=A0A2V2N5L4_9EURY|nr:metal-dependent transcriptional regulator [Methanospirillum lacunae]PWR71507.1 metal-dependent transcriptional regulator [Methanospirillum lacunae]
MAEDKISQRKEDLLEVIFEIVQEKGYAKSRDIAAALQITPATVTDGFKRLSDAGLVNYEPYGGVTLTDAGSRIARRTKDSHLIIRRLLELAGVEAQTADREACIMEHGLSPDSCDKLTRVVTFIEECLSDSKMNHRFREIMKDPKDTMNH